jgi:hypothetical protein
MLLRLPPVLKLLLLLLLLLLLPPLLPVLARHFSHPGFVCDSLQAAMVLRT